MRLCVKFYYVSRWQPRIEFVFVREIRLEILVDKDETGGSLNPHVQGFGRRLYHLLFCGALTVGLLLAHLSRMFQV